MDYKAENRLRVILLVLNRRTTDAAGHAFHYCCVYIALQLLTLHLMTVSSWY